MKTVAPNILKIMALIMPKFEHITGSELGHLLFIQQTTHSLFAYS